MKTATAKATYDDHQTTIDGLLNKIREGLNRHAVSFSKKGNKRNWDYPGSLSGIRHTLQDLSDRLHHEGEYTE